MMPPESDQPVTPGDPHPDDDARPAEEKEVPVAEVTATRASRRARSRPRWAVLLSLASVQVALGVVTLAALVLVTGYSDPALLATTVALGGGVIAWGWPGLLGLPSPRGTATVLYLGTGVLVLTVALTDEAPWLRWLPAALAVAMSVTFGHQLARRDGRPRLVESLSSTALGLALVTSGVCLLPLARTDEGPRLLAAAMAAVAVSALTDLIGRWARLRLWLVPLAMASGGLAGVVVGALVGLHWGPLLLLGVVVAAVSHTVRRVLSVLPAMAHTRPRLVSASSSVLAIGVLPYVISRVFFLG